MTETIFRFDLLTSDTGSRARRGRITTTRGVVQTPAFMPVGTQATV
ncbi:MAG: Queuine tRNA-ribosyltransferase, partial [uncultured Thermomicrobiales bacterium]